MNPRQTLTTGIKRKLLDYASIIKPRITILSLVTTLSGVWLASGGSVSNLFTGLVLLGTGLGASSASALNNFFDRDLDGFMSRTQHRPLPAERVPASHALVIGITSGAGGVVMLSMAANVTAGLLLLFSICFYNGVYTLWLKHTSRFATEISGIAGALAPVIGWVSVTGDVDPEAIVLFGIMFVWQPAHFWALGIKYVDDYRSADLPRYPVVKGVEATKWRMLIYTMLLLPVSLSLALTDSVGSVYVVASLLLGAVYLGVTIYYVSGTVNRKRTMALFGSSVFYLLLLFVSMFLSVSQQ